MARVTVKATARFKAFNRTNLRLLAAVFSVADMWPEPSPQEIVITSANDSGHMTGSRHYADEAIDLRVHNFPSQAAVHRFASALRAELGPQFTVLSEGAGTPNAHLHLQPKKGTHYHGPIA